MARNLGFHGLLYLYGRILTMIKGASRFLFLILIAGACLDEPECFSLNNNIVGITFKNIADGTPSTITFTGIMAGGSDAVFAAAGNKVYLPLNYFTDTTAFLFVQAERTDTIALHYTARAQFVSPDCGERYVLSNLDTVYNTFDSLRLVSRTPGNNNTGNHIEIFN